MVVLIKFLKIKTMESLYSKSIEELRNISDGNKEKKNDIYMVDPRYIVIKNGHNSRNFEDEKVKEHIIGLRESIRERGLLTPLLCRRGEQCGNYIDDNGKEHPLYQWITIDGECRLRAVNMLLDEGYEIDRIEVRSQRRNSNDADDMLDMFTSNQGLPFTEYESAITFKRFINLFKWDVQKIAKKTGKSPTYIYNALKLLDYNEVIQTNLNDKVILPNDVRKIAKEVKESVKNPVDRKGEVERRLQEAIERAKKATELSGSTVKASSFLNTKKTDSVILAEQLDAVLMALPKQESYKLKELEELFDMLSAGHPIKNAINTVFGVKVSATGTEG